MNRQTRRRQARDMTAPTGPDAAKALFAEGNEYQRRGNVVNAIRVYERALTIQPDFPGLAEQLAHLRYNVGNSYARQGHSAQAASEYERAVKLLPGFAAAYGNLVRVLLAQRRSVEASEIAQRGIQRTNSIELKRLFIKSVGRDGSNRKPGPADQLTRAFVEGWTRAAEIAWSAAPLLVKAMDGSTLAQLGGIPLLLAHLVSAPIFDENLERLLTSARRKILFDPSYDTFELACAIAQQSLINEFAWVISPEEKEELARLKKQVSSKEDQDIALKLVTLAMFMPLLSLPQSEELPSHNWPESFAAVVKRHIAEPLEESRLEADIECLTTIADRTSLAVQSQYERNPYPRWVVSDLIEPTTPDALLRRVLPRARAAVYVDPAPSILIAGCGTGQHSITTAKRFPNAKLTAIDLSRASLAYAARKSSESGVSIRYAQADILELSEWPERFDIIEAVGVLHHLSDPIEGWRRLVALLKPSGLMRIGLYSERGRRHIVAARARIAEWGFDADLDGIRQARAALLALPESDIAQASTVSVDFYSVSSCRDLLFHVQEHRFHLPAIEVILQELDLEFLGFDLSEEAKAWFQARFPDTSETDLAAWDKFEDENPDVFTGMFQFWVQRRP